MKTIKKVIKLINLLAEQPLEGKEITKLLDIHPSSTSRILKALRDANFVRIGSNKKYEIGYGLFDVANKSLKNLEVNEIAKPYLEYLNKITGETVHLGVLDDYEAVYLNKIECDHPIRMYSRIGKRVGAYCTGLGKVLLAYLPEKELEQRLNKIEFKKYTKNTIVKKSEFKKDLFKIRERGTAYDNEEHEEDIVCVAAPIFDFYKRVVASISISATTRYKSLEQLKKYEKYLKQTCKEISTALGYIDDKYFKQFG